MTTPFASGRSTAERPVAGRFAALDGLRGLAAMAVLICHALLVEPGYSASYGMGSAQVTGLATWLTFTPLHILWAGTEAVYVFFVMSGFVLTLSVARTSGSGWIAFYVKRLVRLYLPVWAAVALAVLSFAAVAHRPDAGLSGWTEVHTSSITGMNIARDVSLLVKPGAFATQLWSLKWEVLFSMLLPLFLVLAVRVRNWPWPCRLVACLAPVLLGDILSWNWLYYLPMFWAGVLMADALPLLTSLAGRLANRRHWTAIAVVSLLLLTAKWSLTRLLGSGASVEWLWDGMAVLGAVLTVFLFCFNRTAGRLAGTSVVGWLGRRSFSIYLVHEPVIATLAFGLSLRNGWVALLLALPVSLLIGEFFYRWCEMPSQGLAKSWAAAVQRRLAVARAGRKRVVRS